MKEGYTIRDQEKTYTMTATVVDWIEVHKEYMDQSRETLRSGDAYQYYHKVEGNVHYFAKLNNQDGILIALDFSMETINGVSINIIRDLWKNYIAPPKEIKTNDKP